MLDLMVEKFIMRHLCSAFGNDVIGSEKTRRLELRKDKDLSIDRKRRAQWHV
jgi:hypothetical protein